MFFKTPQGNSARSAAIAETSRNVIFLAEEVVIVPRPIPDFGSVDMPAAVTNPQRG